MKYDRDTWTHEIFIDSFKSKETKMKLKDNKIMWLSHMEKGRSQNRQI